MKLKCSAKRKDGRRCEATVRPGRKVCTFHDDTLADDCAEGRRVGGERARRPATLPSDTPELPLGSATDVMAALGETFNLVRTGRMDARVGNCLAVIASSLLRATEAHQLEVEVATLREQVNKIAANRGRTR